MPPRVLGTNMLAGPLAASGSATPSRSRFVLRTEPIHLVVEPRPRPSVRNERILTRGWRGPERDQLITGELRWASAAQPPVVSETRDERVGEKSKHGCAT